METGAGRGRRTRRAERATDESARDTVVIRLPRIDPEAWNWFLDLLPGRALLRVLGDPPEEFFQHARAARRERLLAVRSILDALIEASEHGGGSRAPAREVRID